RWPRDWSSDVCSSDLLAANSELVTFYWQLGNDLIEQQKKYEWGDNFLEQFSTDLRNAFPGMQGFSVTNLKRMRLFAKAYQKSPRSEERRVGKECRSQR